MPGCPIIIAIGQLLSTRESYRAKKVAHSQTPNADHHGSADERYLVVDLFPELPIEEGAHSRETSEQNHFGEIRNEEEIHPLPHGSHQHNAGELGCSSSLVTNSKICMFETYLKISIFGIIIDYIHSKFSISL
jgi:hypothetical protein